MTHAHAIRRLPQISPRAWTVPAFALLATLAATPLRAAAPAPMTLDDVRSGALLFRTHEPGRYVPAPLVGAHVGMQVSGPVARAGIRQEFYNPTGAWLEATYAFPLPENAAVEHLQLTVGDVVIVGRIAERAAARRTYEAARDQGRRAGLVEQHRPNVFTASVANIPPHGTVAVEIRYQQTVPYDTGEYRLRLPLVIGPRYFPQASVVVSGAGEAASDAPTEDDDRAFGSRVLHPDEGKVNPVTIAIELDAGMPLADLRSPHHLLHAADWTTGRTVVRLADGPVPADRDFELVWRPAATAAPVTALFRETRPDGDYLLAIILPPQSAAGVPPSRDLIFILDRSGSMAGTSIVQAKAALGQALSRLRPEDRVNLIRFSHAADVLFPDVRPADAATLRRVQAHLSDTRADGGTEMLAPVRLALDAAVAPDRMQQVVLLTDGAVGNEDAILREIRSRIGARRLFTIGIGSAPNGFLMRKAAEYGRGTHVHIGAQDQIAERMAQLLEKLERPALTGIEARWPQAGDGPAVEAYPRIIPDLYHGEPVVFVARLDGAGGLHPPPLTGLIGPETWTRTFQPAELRPGHGIATLWARAKVEALMDSLHDGAPFEAVRSAVVDTALRHHLATRFTSLVAVEEERTRPEAAPLLSRQVPHNLPHGWDFEKVFGDRLLRRDEPVGRDARLGGATPVAQATVILPKSGTSGPLAIAIGLALLAVAGVAAVVRRYI